MFTSIQRLNHRFLLHPHVTTNGPLKTWKGEDTQSHKTCLLRHLKCNINEQNTLLAAATQELLQWQNTYHPQVSQLLDMFVGPENHPGLWIAVAPPEGQPLPKVLVQSNVLDETEARQLLLELSRVLAFLHSQMPPLFLPDLNPENIWLNEAKKPFLVHYGPLSDLRFGTSRTQNLMNYAAPERQHGHPRAASDLFAVGRCMLYALTAKSPTTFDIDDLKVSVDFAQLLTRLTALAPEERFQTAAELRRVLQAPTPAPMCPDTLETKPNKPNVFAALQTFIAKYPISPVRVAGVAGCGLLLWFGSLTLWNRMTPPPTVTDPGQIFVTPQPIPTAAITEPIKVASIVTPVNHAPVPTLSPAPESTLAVNLLADLAAVETALPMGLPKGGSPVAVLSDTPAEPLTDLPPLTKPQYGFFELPWEEDSQVSFILDGEQLYIDSNNDESMAQETALNLANSIYTFELPVLLPEREKTALPLAYSPTEQWLWSTSHLTGRIKWDGQELPAVTYVKHPSQGLWRNSGLWLDLDHNNQLDATEHFKHGDVVQVGGKSFLLQLMAP